MTADYLTTGFRMFKTRYDFFYSRDCKEDRSCQHKITWDHQHDSWFNQEQKSKNKPTTPDEGNIALLRNPVQSEVGDLCQMSKATNQISKATDFQKMVSLYTQSMSMSLEIFLSDIPEEEGNSMQWQGCQAIGLRSKIWLPLLFIVQHYAYLLFSTILWEIMDSRKWSQILYKYFAMSLILTPLSCHRTPD